MSKPQITPVKESASDLRKLLKKASPLIAPRIKMLLVEKEHAVNGISRRVLASEIGVDPNSITNWRALYKKGGIDLYKSIKRQDSKNLFFQYKYKRL